MDQAAYDAAAVHASTHDFGEPAAHLAADATRTAVTALWSPQALDDLGQGFVADAALVHVPRAQVRRIVRGDVVERYPGTFDTLLLQDGWALLLEDGAEAGLETSAAESWQVNVVRESPAWWELACLHQPRPAPRGA